MEWQSLRGRFQRLIVEYYRGRATEWIGAQASIQQVASALLRDMRIVRPPVDPLDVAAFMHIAVERRTERSRTLGRLFPDGGDLRAVICCSPASLSARERFTLAHECGHSLFYAEGARGYERILPPWRGGYASAERSARREEGLCDAFARALLLPEPWCSASTPLLGCLRDAAGSARIARVSLEVFARRLVYDCGAWPNHAVYVTRTASGSNEDWTTLAIRGAAARRLPSARFLRDEVNYRCDSAPVTVHMALDRIVRSYAVPETEVVRTRFGGYVRLGLRV